MLQRQKTGSGSSERVTGNDDGDLSSLSGEARGRHRVVHGERVLIAISLLCSTSRNIDRMSADVYHDDDHKYRQRQLQQRAVQYVIFIEDFYRQPQPPNCSEGTIPLDCSWYETSTPTKQSWYWYQAVSVNHDDLWRHILQTCGTMPNAVLRW